MPDAPAPGAATPEAAAAELLRRRRARESTADYTDYLTGRPLPPHGRFVAEKFDRLERGEYQNLLLCMPPGHLKSFISQHFISRFMARHPGQPVIHASHTQKLVARWGGRIRDRFNSPEHQKLYPNDRVTSDVRASDEWETELGSSYIAAGVDTAIQGRRGLLAVIDDPLRNIADAESPSARAALWDWYGGDLNSRLIPGAMKVLIQTRFHLDDLAGRIIQNLRDGLGEPWEMCVLPAIATESDPMGREPGTALWPDYYTLEKLERTRTAPETTRRLWSSLYQQSPTVDTGGVIDRTWFKLWRSTEPPVIKFVLQSWDTALTANKESAYSACSTWGVFEEPETKAPAVILMSACRDRWEWPDLRRMAQRLAVDYRDDQIKLPIKPDGKHKPDMVLVEAKANGQALLLDLMRAGLSVMGFNPDKYGDKIARVRLVTDLIENGRVYVPAGPPGFTAPRRWAEEFIDQCAAFPAAASRDYVDTMTQAFLRIKASGWVANTENIVPDLPGQGGDPGMRPAFY